MSELTDALRQSANAIKTASLRATLMNEAAAELDRLTARVAELEAAQRWIPVGERLPRSNKPVQVYMPKLYMSVRTGFYDRYYGEDDDDWHEHWVAPSEVTHWKPLPKPPEEGGEK